MEIFLGVASITCLFVLIVMLLSDGRPQPNRIFRSFAYFLLPLWALAVWFPPFGPSHLGIPWVQIICLALVVAMLALAIHKSTERKTRENKIDNYKYQTAFSTDAILVVFAVLALVSIVLGYTLTESITAH